MVFWTFVICVLVGCVFLFVIFYGAPFLPTRSARVREAVDMLGLKPGQTLLELGSGDGRILRAAARRGIASIGYELNPILVWYSRLLALRYRGLIEVRLGNYWNGPLPQCDAIYVFLLNPYMRRMDAKISQDLRRPLRVVSFAFPFPDRKPAKEANGLFVYDWK